MLKALHVKNLALIEEADISFDEGFTVLSGETGAGKSILLESIHLALGGRASKDLIRTGKDFALAELTFVPESEELKNIISELGVWTEDSEILISRKITADKSLIRINGETVSASFAKELGEYLLDIHGQNEHQSLLKKSRHIAILDEFGKDDISKLKAEYKAVYDDYRKTIKKLSVPGMDETARLRELDFIEFEINEIEAADVKKGEEEELEGLYSKLSNGRSIMTALGRAHELIGNDSASSAGSLIGDAASELSNVCDYDPELNDIREQLLVLESEAAECARAISGYLNDFSYDEQLLSETSDRLDVIREIEKKYGSTYEAIMTHLAEAKHRKEELEEMAEGKELLLKQKQQLEKQLMSLSDKLSVARKIVAERLDKAISENLTELNFLQVRFEICIEKADDFKADGMDNVEFMISMNKGEALKPLEMVASGGELSRIMLAIKTVLADIDTIETQIFDEIDAGISGVTASCVAKKLRQIGRSRQVFCISHLPQIVAAADNHFLIEKHISGDNTLTTVSRLDEEGSIKEIARILGGDMVTDMTLASARELKNNR